MTEESPSERASNREADGFGVPPESLVLNLEAFLPYRLSVLSNTISRAIAADYAERFQLSIPEWRVMAVLRRFPGISAAEVARRTAMDKVRVSRAVASLIRAGRLERTTDRRDRRRSVLRLSSEGRRIYREIVPFALRRERQLYDVLSDSDRADLDRLLAKLMDQATVL